MSQTAPDKLNASSEASAGRAKPARAGFMCWTRHLAPWVATLLSNAPLLLLLLLMPAAQYLEGPAVRELADGTRLDPNIDPTRLRVIMLIGINIILAVSLHLINGISGQFSLGHAGFMAVGAYIAGYTTLTYAPNWERPASPLLYIVSLAVALGLVAGVILLLYLLIHSTRKLSRGLPSCLTLVVVIWIAIDLIMGNRAGAAPGFVVWAPLINWITANFTAMATGGEKPLTFLIALLGGGLAAAAAGLVVGLPSLRLRGDYLAIATLGFAFIISNLITLSKPLGAATGLSLTPYLNFAVPDENIPAHFVFPWIYGTAIITTFVVWRLTQSATGKAILAVREDEIAASAVGIDTTRFKIMAFVIGAFFAGVAGGLYAHIEPARLDPKEFDFTRSIEIVVIVVIGGLGNLWGAILSAIVLTFLPFFLQQPQFWVEFFLRPVRGEHAPALQLPAWLTSALAQVAANRMMAYALVLILLMLTRGRNLFGWVGRLMPRRRVDDGAGEVR